jgi:hypothetical protein
MGRKNESIPVLDGNLDGGDIWPWMPFGRETMWLRMDGILAGATLHRDDVITSIAFVRNYKVLCDVNVVDGHDITLRYRSREGQQLLGSLQKFVIVPL